MTVALEVIQEVIPRGAMGFLVAGAFGTFVVTSGCFKDLPIPLLCGMKKERDKTSCIMANKADA